APSPQAASAPQAPPAQAAAPKPEPPKPEPVKAAPAPTAESPRPDNVVDISRGTRQSAEQQPSGEPSAPAAPSVRRMARELGVDIDEVAGSGDEGRISIEDVKAHAKRLISSAAGAPSGAVAGPRAAAEPLPDFSKWGQVERQPMKGVRRKTAEHLGASWAQVPLVTQYDSADITGFEEIRRRHAKQAAAPGENAAPPLSVTALAVKIAAAALKAFPQFNVSIDMAAEEIIVKKYIHIGVAVDTDRGLLVPVIRDADTKTLLQLSAEISELAAKARARKLTL